MHRLFRSRRDPRPDTLNRRLRRRRSLVPGVLSALEPRLLLSDTYSGGIFYDVGVVASTWGNGFTGFGDLVGLNDRGDVAFLGIKSSGEGLYLKPNGGGIRNINPSFSNTPQRSYGRGVTLNDNGKILARDQYQNSQTLEYYARIWDGTRTDSFRTVGESGVVNGLASILSFGDLTEDGDATFAALGRDARTRSIEYGGADRLTTLTDTIETVSPGIGSTPRPQVTSSGRVLVANPETGRLILSGSDGWSLGSNAIVSRTKGGFRRIGAAPDVSDDGRVVVFSGDRGRGPGVFAALEVNGSYATIVRIAGEGLDGFVHFDPTDAVRVNNTLEAQRGVTIAFVGTHETMGKGLYTARLSVFGSSMASFDPDAPTGYLVNGITPVARVGDQVLTSNPLTARSVLDLELWDGLNDTNRGQLAFWARMSDGSQAVLAAQPRPVVRVDFDPTAAEMTEHGTSSVFTSLAGLGVLDAGWDGSFAQSLAALGLQVNASHQDQIVEKVQAAFAQAGSLVRVVGRASDAAPVPGRDYQPHVVTDSNGNRRLNQQGNPILRGAFQTIYVGGAPKKKDANGNTVKDENGFPVPVQNAYYGVAQVIYEGNVSSSLDYFNQVAGDQAVVFADLIARQVPALDDLVTEAAYTIAHEAGHNLGLFHLDNQSVQTDLMHGGTVPEEYRLALEFANANRFVHDRDERGETISAIAGLVENSAARLAFAAGVNASNAARPAAPDPGLLAFDSPSLRAKLAPSLAVPNVSAARLLLGVAPRTAGGDGLPAFLDLGSGDLATLLSAADLNLNAGDGLILLGSTTGARPDIVAVPAGQAGAVSALTLSALGLAFDPGLRTPAGDAQSPAAMRLYRLDPGGPVELGTVEISTVDPHAPPVIAPVPDVQLDERSGAASIQLQVSYPPGAESATRFTLAAGTTPGLDLDGHTGLLRFSPPQGLPPGTYHATVRAWRDGNYHAGSTATVAFVLASAVNDPPVLDPLPDRLLLQGDSLTFTATARDPDGPGDRLTYSLDAGAPAGASLDRSTGAFSWSPCDAAPGTYSLTVRVTDSGSPAKSAARALTIEVAARLPLRAGDLDPSFGDRGFVVLPRESSVPGSENLALLSLEAGPESGLVVTHGPTWQKAISQLLADGSRDPAFARSGLWRFPGGLSTFRLDSLARQTDGSVLAVGQGVALGDSSPDWSSVLLRFLPDGSLDSTFGGSGQVLLPTRLVAIDRAFRGPIVQTTTGRWLVFGTEGIPGQGSYPIARAYRADGSLDSGYGASGELHFPSLIGQDMRLAAASPLPDGELGLLVLSEGRLSLARLTADGRPDLRFGAGGIVRIGDRTWNWETPALLLPDGKVLAAAARSDQDGPDTVLTVEILRFLADGTADASFGTAGAARVSGVRLPAQAAFDPFAHATQALAVAPDGRIIVAGHIEQQQVGDDGRTVWLEHALALARFLPDGAADLSFGAGGLRQIHVGAGGLNVRDVRVQADGDVLVAADWNGDALLARVLGQTPAFTAGTIHPEQAEARVGEGAGSITLHVLRSGGSDGTVSVRYATADGTGLAGADYQAVSGTLVFEPGELCKSIVVPIRQDALAEGDESFLLTLADAVGGAELGAARATRITIQDDEAGAGLFRFRLTSERVIEGRETYFAVIERVGGSSGSVTVPYQVGGTATPGADVLAAAGSVTFAAGQAEAPIPPGILDDTAAEAIETVVLTLGSPSGGGLLGSPSVMTISLLDDAAASTFSWFSTTPRGDEDQGVARVVIRRQGGEGHAATVTYETVAGGSARPGVDYTPVSGAVTFEPGETERAVEIPLRDGNDAGGDRTLALRLRSAHGNAQLDAAPETTLTLRDDESLPGTFILALGERTVPESAGVARLTVVRARGAGGTVSVRYATADLSARAGRDYTAVSGTLTFGPGETAKTIEVPLSDDRLAGSDRSFLVQLTEPSGGAALGTVARTLVTIADDETPIRPDTVAWAAPEVVVVEGQGVVRVALRRGEVSRYAAVFYATEDGTARAGADYSASRGWVVFAPGESEKVVEIPLADDAMRQGSRGFLVRIGTVTGGAAASPSPVLITIADDDPLPGRGHLRFEVSSGLVTERPGYGGPGVTDQVWIRVLREGGLEGGTSFRLRLLPGSDARNYDWIHSGQLVDLTTGPSFTFGPGETVKEFLVRVIRDDSVKQGHRSVRVALADLSDGAGLAAPAMAEVRILDDETLDAQPPQGRFVFTTATVTVQEGPFAQAVLEVRRLDGLSGRAVVHYRTRSGAAIGGPAMSAGYDFIALDDVLEFAPQESSRIVAVPISLDSLAEGSETFSVELYDPTPGTTLGDPATAVVTILDAGGGPSGPGTGPGPAPPPVRVISPPRLVRGRRSVVTGFTVRFSGDLSRATAVRLANYALIQAGRDRKFGTRDDRIIRFKKASYSRAARTVTLTPPPRLSLAQTTRFRVVSGGVRDARGQRLDGNDDGVAGGDYLASLFRGKFTRVPAAAARGSKR